MCEKLCRRLYFYVGLWKIGGLWFSIPNPTTLLTAQICSTKTNCIFSRKAPVTYAPSVNTKYCLFSSRRKLNTKREGGRKVNCSIRFNGDSKFLQYPSPELGAPTSMSLNISNANFSYHSFLKMSFIHQVETFCIGRLWNF